VFGASAAVVGTDSIAVADSTTNLRGIEREERYASDVWRTGLNATLYLPRIAVSALLYSTGRGTYVATDPRVIELVEEFLYFYEKQLGWHPVLNLDSDFKPEYGLKAFYHHARFGTDFKGKYSNKKKWKTNAQLTLRGTGSNVQWKATLTGQRTEDDDFLFYGIGSEPRGDARSGFLVGANSDNATYFQRRDKLQFIFGVCADTPWEFFLTSFYQQREVSNISGDDQFNDVFDIAKLPGGESGKDWRSIYSEIELRLDTRKNQTKSLRGVSLETHLGYSGGIGNDKRFMRSGFDMAAYYPILKRNRLVIPRIVFNMVENLNTDESIPYFDYPRHPTFRGASSRKLLRQDNLSFVPSLEYRWPLSHKFSGFLFSDALVVSKTLSELSTNNAPYAFGIGMKMHGGQSESGRLEVAYGSQGLRIILHFGSVSHKNARSEWR